jgi:spermidine/putrescine transport system permease protein
MFGDYYTNDLLGTESTSMYGNLIDNAVNSSGQTPEAGSLVLILIVLVMVPMLYYLGATKRATEEGA